MNLSAKVVVSRSSYRLLLSSYCTEAFTNRSSSVIIGHIRTNSTEVQTAIENKQEKDKLFKKLEIELRGIDPAVLNSYSRFATTAANHLDIEIGKCWEPRKAIHDRMTLLKSVHIYKKHRVQYEVRTHFVHMNFHKLTGSTLDTFLEYIERNLPEGISLNAAKTEILEFPEHLREMPVQE